MRHRQGAVRSSSLTPHWRQKGQTQYVLQHQTPGMRSEVQPVKTAYSGSAPLKRNQSSRTSHCGGTSRTQTEHTQGQGNCNEQAALRTHGQVFRHIPWPETETLSKTWSGSLVRLDSSFSKPWPFAPTTNHSHRPRLPAPLRPSAATTAGTPAPRALPHQLRTSDSAYESWRPPQSGSPRPSHL